MRNLNQCVFLSQLLREPEEALHPDTFRRTWRCSCVNQLMQRSIGEKTTDPSFLHNQSFPQTALFSRRVLVPSPSFSRLLTFALPSPGWPWRPHFLWTCLGSLILSPLFLTEASVPSDGGGVSKPKLFLEDRQFSSGLQKADGIGITQHGRADGLGGEPCSLAQPHEQEGQTILGERMPQLGEQERFLRLWGRRRPGWRETCLLQIGADGTLPFFRKGEGTRASTFAPHRHRSFGTVHIREM
jgi:hypothetical protein